MMSNKTINVFLLFLLFFNVESYAQKKDKPSPPVAQEVKKPEAKKEPKPYKKVVDSTAITQKGLMRQGLVSDCLTTIILLRRC